MHAAVLQQLVYYSLGMRQLIEKLNALQIRYRSSIQAYKNYRQTYKIIHLVAFPVNTQSVIDAKNYAKELVIYLLEPGNCIAVPSIIDSAWLTNCCYQLCSIQFQFPDLHFRLHGPLSLDCQVGS